MNDPSDKELEEFIVAFSGWKPTGIVRDMNDVAFPEQPPRYLYDLNAWLRDVVPRLNSLPFYLQSKWDDELCLRTGGGGWKANADARSRCLALWRALGGKLP